MDYVAFDLEIAEPLPEGTRDWQGFGSLGISCAATFKSGEREPRTWHGGLERTELDGALGNMVNPYARKMSPGQCDKLADYLIQCQADGFPAVTWNGLGFDFAVLARECTDGKWNAVVELALGSIDMGFHMLAVKGYMVALNTAAIGLGVETKTEGMHGAMAPAMWRDGRENQDKVLEYVAQDARVTAQVFEAIQEKGVLPWTSRSGNAQYWSVGHKGLLAAKDANALPLPDTSWMTNPRPRTEYTGWTNPEQMLEEEREELPF